jgi:predicted aldo/keto reductase-like oxidoreductase
VTCVKTLDKTRHEGIIELAGLGWHGSRQDVVEDIEKNQHRFYTEASGNRAYLVVRELANGKKYVQTQADGLWTNNLLELPICS